jgi:hypothetical protein
MNDPFPQKDNDPKNSAVSAAPGNKNVPSISRRRAIERFAFYGAAMTLAQEAASAQAGSSGSASTAAIALPVNNVPADLNDETSMPASPLPRTQLRGFATYCAARHSTVTIRRSIALALPSRLAHIGWCFGPSTPNTAAFRRRSETQVRGLCFQARHTHTCISAARRGTETSTLQAMRRVGPCSTRRVPECARPERDTHPDSTARLSMNGA